MIYSLRLTISAQDTSGIERELTVFDVCPLALIISKSHSIIPKEVAAAMLGGIANDEPDFFDVVEARRQQLPGKRFMLFCRKIRGPYEVCSSFQKVVSFFLTPFSASKCYK